MGPERRIGLLMTALDANSRNADGSPASRGRTLWTACAAHALHDGYTDLIYLLLPIGRPSLGSATVRGVLCATCRRHQWRIAGAGRMGRRAFRRTHHAGSRHCTGGGRLPACRLFGWACRIMRRARGDRMRVEYATPIASAAVSRAYQTTHAVPSAPNNFAGDVGKAAIPSGASLLLALMSWHHMVWFLSALGAVVAVAVAIFFPANLRPISPDKKKPNTAPPARMADSRCC